MAELVQRLGACFPACQSSQSERAQRRRSREIDALLARERRYVRRLVKILLLGAGESGKSTFLKQMRIIHGKDFDSKALEEFRDTIFENVIKEDKLLMSKGCDGLNGSTSLFSSEPNKFYPFSIPGLGLRNQSESVLDSSKLRSFYSSSTHPNILKASGAWLDQDRLLVIITPRNLVLLTISTSAPLMQTGACPPLHFRKSITNSFIFLMLT
eukprot:g38758.t1